jgi:hypothetical protein
MLGCRPAKVALFLGIQCLFYYFFFNIINIGEYTSNRFPKSTMAQKRYSKAAVILHISSSDLLAVSLELLSSPSFIPSKHSLLNMQACYL